MTIPKSLLVCTSVLCCQRQENMYPLKSYTCYYLSQKTVNCIPETDFSESWEKSRHILKILPFAWSELCIVNCKFMKVKAALIITHWKLKTTVHEEFIFIIKTKKCVERDAFIKYSISNIEILNHWRTWQSKTHTGMLNHDHPQLASFWLRCS